MINACVVVVSVSFVGHIQCLDVESPGSNLDPSDYTTTISFAPHFTILPQTHTFVHSYTLAGVATGQDV